MNEKSVRSVWVKGKGMPSTSWNVIAKIGAGAAVLDHEMEAKCVGWQSSRIEEPGTPVVEWSY